MTEAVAVGRRFAIAAAGLATCGALAIAWTRPLPDEVVTLLGGPTGVERWGGLRVDYRPPGGAPVALTFPHRSQAETDELLAALASGLTMHEVLESDAFARAAALIDLGTSAGGPVRLEEDTWTATNGRGERHRVPYLDALSRDALERAVATAQAAGWQLPAGAQVGFEEHADRDTGATRWRTYELAAEPLITSLDVEDAIASFDPTTDRPLVLLSFTPDGATRFCEVTGRLAGRKLAIALGGRVRSAPILEGAICGGHASIALGAGEPAELVREAQELARTLRSAPPGGEILKAEVVPAAAADWRYPVARLLLGLLVGLGVGAATALMLWLARPSWRAPAPRSAGPWPWRRLAVTLSAPALLLLGGWLTVPGVDRQLLLAQGDGYRPASVTMVGVHIVIGAFVVVELAALAVPRWRWRRHDARGRAGLGRAVVVVATALALIQSYFVVYYLERLDVADPGWWFRVTAMLTFTTATLLLAGAAAFISERGLGNGYGALLSSGVAIELGRAIAGGPGGPGWRPSVHGLPEVLALAAIAALTACLLRWRVGGEDRRLALTSPASGDSPLGSAPGALTLLLMLTTVGLGRPLQLDALTSWVSSQLARPFVPLLLAALLAPLWAWILARPPLLARRAQQAGLGAPTWRDWSRAALLSVYFAIAVGALRAVADYPGALVDGLAVVAFTAVVMDIASDARAYRAGAVPAAALHQAQHAALAEQVLARAGIECHLHAGYLRALGTFFMPYAPIVVLVPPERAEEARALLDEALRPPTGTPPEARVVVRPERRAEATRDGAPEATRDAAPEATRDASRDDRASGDGEPSPPPAAAEPPAR